MARSLVIVESPGKIRTINRYLGNEFIVKSSVGHIRDLPTRGKGSDPKQRAKQAAITRKLSPAQKVEHRKKQARSQLIRRMGVNPDQGWQADYEVLPGKEKVVQELKTLAAKSDMIYLATDLDREGEAIAWHLREVIGGDPARFRRVVFNEITQNAIQAAFENPGEIDENRVEAQQARRFLDRVVGFEVSPLLWSKVARGLSAGRVQSVAVRLIVEREREIRAFVPEEYWEVFADLKRSTIDTHNRFQVIRENGNAFRPNNNIDANHAIERLGTHPFTVADREQRATSSRPNAPFITSTLQQAASTRLGFSVRKTMATAQSLYEGGYITYMRTDSTNISIEALESVCGHIATSYGPEYLPEQPNVYTSKADAQEAHEAIRPTNIAVTQNELEKQETDAQGLYQLIRAQFVASQMTRAEYLNTTYTVQAGPYELRVRGRILKFDGFTRVLPTASRKEDEIELPDLKIGDVVDCVDTEAVQHFTKPTPRYGEASLVKELEKLGIGRPSTYAAIISTIQDRGYVTLKTRRFYAEKIGELVTDRLIESFEELLDYSFTANMEEQLDQIACGSKEWKSVLNTFYQDFSAKMVVASNSEGGMRPNSPTETDIECLECGRPMQVRTAGTGVFLGCSGYSLKPKERCTHTLNLTPGDEIVDVDADDEGESRILRMKSRCRLCSTVMDSYLIDENRRLHLCANNPDCSGFIVENGEFRIKGYEGPVLDCDKCGAEMQLKNGRFGKYFGCTNEKCSNTRKLLRNGEAAPPKADPIPMPELKCVKVDDHYVLRDGAAGIFLAASAFPKHRETRAPLVSEIKVHGNELDPKYRFLLSAPDTDPDGIATVIKYSRKNKEQYVASEKNGKATGWLAHYRDGQWLPQEKKSPKKRLKLTG
ncbi:MAG: type I DNA topoisomerase [Pseudomonadales bacterium]